MNHPLAALLGVLAVLLVGIAKAGEPEKPNITVETVFSGLDHPCGVAVQPSTGNIFVSESGAGQIVRFLPTDLGKPTAAVTGFLRGNSHKGPMHNGGPLGLAFLHQNLIVVGGSERKDGEDVIRVFELPADAAANGALNYNDAKRTLGRMWTGETKSTGEGRFWGMAMSPSALWITSQGERENGWVLKASIGGNTLEEITPFLRTREATQIEGPMGIAVRNSREFLVVGLIGKLDASRDSVLAFFHMRSHGLMMALPAQLHDLVGLAYSPSSNRLYAVDLAWSSPNDGGLYRLDSAMVDGRVGVKPVKLVSLDRPTALAFAPDNTLYVTAFGADGNAGDSAKAKRGVLIKIAGDL